MTEETNNEALFAHIKEEETKNLKEMTRPQLLKVLAEWRNKITIKEITPERVQLEAYVILVIDEIFERMDSIKQRLDHLEERSHICR